MGASDMKKGQLGQKEGLKAPILVTGGTGFWGRHLVPLLRTQGYRVRMVSRTKPPAAWCEGENAIDWVQGDLRDSTATARMLEGVQAVYHLAGMVSFKPQDGRTMYALHVDATRALLQGVHASGGKPRVILASTSGTTAVFTHARVGTEEDDYPIQTVGRWPYYLSKIYQEKLALEYCKAKDIPLVVLNPSLLLGPGDDRLSSTWIVTKFLQRDIFAMPRGGISFVDARDAAQAALNALTQGQLYGRHLMGVNMEMEAFFQRLESLTGVPAPRLKLPKWVKVTGAQVLQRLSEWRGVDVRIGAADVEIGEHWFWCDASKAQRLLGFAPRDVYETLHETVQYVRALLP